MEFENSHKLKGYLESESKRLNIHSNYAYTYYFIRKFLEILYREHSDIFMVKGSISQMAHTLKLTRAITDADLASNIDLIDASYILEKTVKKKEDEIKFSIKNRFTTTNNTINFKILCNYGHIQQLIKIDLKHQESCDMVKKELPVIMKKDISFDISTYPLEMHIATKLYILLRNTDKTISISKERRRLKDFYDLHFLLQTNYNEELLCKYFDEICKQRNDINLDLVDLDLLNDKFIDTNQDLYLSDKKRYGFSDIEFKDLVYETKDELGKRIR